MRRIPSLVLFTLFVGWSTPAAAVDIGIWAASSYKGDVQT